MYNIHIALPVGQVSALLGATEFIITTLTIYSLPILTGRVFNLWKRFIDDTIIFDGSSKNFLKRQIGIDLTGLFIAVWFTICIVLVESRLETHNFISSKTYNSTRWVRMKGDVGSNFGFISTPHNLELDNDAIEASMIIPCDFGIESISFGLHDAIAGENTNYVYPNCVERYQNNTGIPKDKLKMKYPQIYLERVYNHSQSLYNQFYIPLRLLSWATFVPYPGGSINLNNSAAVDMQLYEDKNISTLVSGYHTFLSAHEWDFGDINIRMLGNILYQKLGEHYKPFVSEIESHLITDCIFDVRNSTKTVDSTNVTHLVSRLDTDCIERNLIGTEHLATVSFANVAVAMSLSEKDNQGIVCTNAAIEQQYLILPSDLFIEKERNKSILLPFSTQVNSGKCEEVYNTLGLFSMIYSSYAEWSSNFNQHDHLTRHQRLHAYMMAFARYYFPYREILPERNESISFHISE